MANLGSIYQTLGKIEKARLFWQEALAVYDAYRVRLSLLWRDRRIGKEETVFTWFKKRFTKGFKKPKEEGQKREYHDDGAKPLDEDAFNSLHIGYEMRSQFMYGIPLSRERYVGQVRGHYNDPPTYEEYRRLFEKYQNIIRERECWSEYYFRHLE